MDRFAVGHRLLQRQAQALVDVVLAPVASGGQHYVAVGDNGHMPHNAMQRFGKLPGDVAHFADGRIFFENDFAFTIGIYFQGIPLTDPQGAPDLLGDDYAPQFIDAPDNASSFHSKSLLRKVVFALVVSTFPEAFIHFRR